MDVDKVHAPPEPLRGDARLLPREVFVTPADAYPAATNGLPSWWRPIASRGTPPPTKVTIRRKKSPATDGSGRKRPSLRPGTIVGRYRIEEFLGSGSFAAVYRASHLALKSPFSLKILHDDIMKSRPGLARMLCDEARIAAPVQHPNLVRVIDLCQGVDLAYIVMEYVQGSSLAAVIRDRTRLPPLETVEIGIQVARGLEEAQRHGIIHRDIKPANIMIATNGDVKVIDLGLAHRQGDVKPINSRGRTGMIGTPLYMAPEQADNPEEVDFRADIYALGATLYHAAVGNPPFPGRKSAELIEAKKEDRLTPPERFGVELPEEFRDVLYWFLRKEKAARPESYYVVIEALEAIRRSLTTEE